MAHPSVDSIHDFNSSFFVGFDNHTNLFSGPFRSWSNDEMVMFFSHFEGVHHKPIFENVKQDFFGCPKTEIYSCFLEWFPSPWRFSNDEVGRLSKGFCGEDVDYGQGDEK